MLSCSKNDISALTLYEAFVESEMMKSIWTHIAQ